MARTVLFSRLRRIASKAAQPVLQDGQRSLRISRRGLLASAGVSLLGCGPGPTPAPIINRPPMHRIAVIGAGIAGLHCAYRLAQAGADVTVYEANGRVGGRTFTGQRMFPRAPNLLCEFGAEFIAENHATMLALARELEIALDDRVASTAEGASDVLWFSEQELSLEPLAEQLSDTAHAIAQSLIQADADPAILRELDNTTLASWLDQQVSSSRYPELNALLKIAYRAEFGLEAGQQSALNLLRLIDLDADQLRGLLLPEARFHPRLGSDIFAKSLRTAFDEASKPSRDRVKLSTRVVAIEIKNEGSSQVYQLTLQEPNGTGSVADAEHLVFALPFSVLRELDLTALQLSEAKQTVIDELGYARATKYVAGFTNKIWKSHNRTGSVLSDLSFQEVWDGSLGQPDSAGVLSFLISGDAGARANQQPVQDSMTAYLKALAAVFPEVNSLANYQDGSAVRMHWPSAPLFRGSYSCLRPGQWPLQTAAGRSEGNAHFCGEHCSLDFRGTMEGAAETGALAAAQVLDDLGLRWPPALREIVELKTVVPQPGYRGSTAEEVGIVERRKTLERAHAEFVAELANRNG